MKIMIASLVALILLASAHIASAQTWEEEMERMRRETEDYGRWIIERDQRVIERLESNRPWSRTGGNDCAKARNAVYC